MKKRAFPLIALFIYIIALIGISENIYDAFLWYDEAGQFWIARGLNHDSAPLQATQGLPQVIANNAAYNYDPGGFSILLHLWTKISTSYLWMRFLPFLFFLGTSLAFIQLSYRWTANTVIALGTGVLPFLFPYIVRSGFEIRAYSMEYLGVVLGVAGLYALRSRLTYTRLFVVGCIFSVFLTSRYSLVVVIFTVSLCIMYLIVKSPLGSWRRVLAGVLYAVPLMGSLAYAYVFALRVQDPQIRPLFYLPYLSNNLTLLWGPKDNLLYLLVIGGLTIAFITIAITGIPGFRKYQAVLFVALSSNLLYVGLSMLGAYPWDPWSRYGLPYFVVTLLSAAAILGELIALCYRRWGASMNVGVVAMLLILLFLNRTHRLVRGDTQQILRCLETVDFAAYDRIYVDRWASPSIRYLYEYGAFSGSQPGIYPGRFHFATALPHKFLLQGVYSDAILSKQKMNDLLEYDLLITPELYNSGDNDKWVSVGACNKWAFVKRN